jgi:hypothetical protein
MASGGVLAPWLGVVVVLGAVNLALECAKGAMTRTMNAIPTSSGRKLQTMFDELTEPVNFILTFEYKIVTVLEPEIALKEINVTSWIEENDVFDVLPTFALALTSPSGIPPLAINMSNSFHSGTIAVSSTDDRNDNGDQRLNLGTILIISFVIVGVCLLFVVLCCVYRRTDLPVRATATTESVKASSLSERAQVFTYDLVYTNEVKCSNF